jgi:protein-S-isoprenylcysteine O-methyltransferase Ste14
MDLDATFRPVAIVAFFTIIAIALPFRITSQSTGEKLDRTQEGITTMIALRLGGLVLWGSVIAFMINPASMKWSSLPLTATERWSGAGLCVLTGLLLIWTLRSLGPNLTDTVVIRQAHALVTRGPYRWVRHPFYDCMMLFMIGTALITANWFVLASGLVVFAILAARSRTEEEKLLERFGEPYRAYRASTGRFIPGVGRVG